MEKNSFKILSIFLVILSMITIFLFSMESGKSSNKTSKTVAKEILVFATGDKEVSDEKVEHFYKNNIVVIRKCAHFSEFAILGILIINIYYIYRKKLTIKSILICLLLACLYACTDEIHQIYVAGRTAKVFDVMIDTFGAFIGCMIYYFAYKSRKKKKLA